MDNIEAENSSKGSDSANSMDSADDIADLLLTSLGLTKSTDRTDVTACCDSFLEKKGYTPQQVWVESFRYNILRLGVTNGTYHYLALDIDELSTVLMKKCDQAPEIRIARRTEHPE